MTPEKEQQLIEDVRDIKLAVVGDRHLGVEGLVGEVKTLQKWRSKLDLRVATISGFIAAALAFIKYLFTKQ